MLRTTTITLAGWLMLSSCLWATNHVVVVLDDSGSMNDAMPRQNLTRMTAAKRALLTVLDILPDDTHVGIVLLNGRLEGDPWVIPLGPVNLPRVRNLLDKVQAGGGTKLGKFLKIGADELLATRGKQHYGTYRLLVVTDGEANDPKLVDRYLPEILARGLTVDVIGVDMNEKHSLATRVHSYRQADNPESLTQAIREVFAETSADADAMNDAGESDFELLQAFPAELAIAALGALADSGNEEIGQGGSAGRRSSSKRRGGPGSKKGISRIPLLAYLIGAVILWSFLSKLFRNRRA